MNRPAKAETGIQKQIKEALEEAGFLVRRVHSGSARVRRGYMQFAEKGTADLVVQLRGPACVWLEVKTEDGKQTTEQLDFGALILARNGYYDVARSPLEAVQKAFARQAQFNLRWMREAA